LIHRYYCKEVPFNEINGETILIIKEFTELSKINEIDLDCTKEQTAQNTSERTIFTSTYNCYSKKKEVFDFGKNF
jgi:hypothetical protein